MSIGAMFAWSSYPGRPSFSLAAGLLAAGAAQATPARAQDSLLGQHGPPQVSSKPLFGVTAPSALLALLQDSATTPAGGARTDYAVVVHKDNPTQTISETELRRIFKADVQFWPRSGTVVELLLPRSGSSTKNFLQERLYRMTDLQLKRYWLELIYQNRIVEAPRAVPSSQVAVQMLERLRGSITILPAKDVVANVKVVPIDGKRPGEEAYPLWTAQTVQANVQPQDGRERAHVSEASAPVSGIPQQEAEAQAPPFAVDASMTMDEWDGEGWPPLNFRVFAHGRFEYEEETTAGVETENSDFTIEVVDLLMTSALTERSSVLAEVTYEAQDEGDFVLEVERLLLKYRANDAFSVEAGRFLTGIGYWNTRYHHGEWLQTSTDRPEVLDFEDDTGLLPIHNVGLSFKGAFPTEALAVDYTLEIANGRGPTPDTSQVKIDGNDVKAINASIGVEPGFLPGLRFGGGIYFDDIPENTDAGAGTVHGPIDEQIASLYGAYNDTRWEVMGEYFWIDHEEAGVSADSSGWYVQLGRHLGDWTPYARVDAVDRSNLDTYYETTDNGFTYAAGLRWDIGKHVALTVQYEHADTDAPPGDEDSDTDTIVFQWSVVF